MSILFIPSSILFSAQLHVNSSLRLNQTLHEWPVAGLVAYIITIFQVSYFCQRYDPWCVNFSIWMLISTTHLILVGQFPSNFTAVISQMSSKPYHHHVLLHWLLVTTNDLLYYLSLLAQLLWYQLANFYQTLHERSMTGTGQTGNMVIK